GGLARGVAPAHYQHVRALAGPGLVRGCRVVHAASLELATPLHAEQAVVGPRGNEEALPGHRLPPLELADLVGVVEAEAERGGGEGEASPELVGLEQGALGEIRPRDPRGKTEVVLDAHAPTRLAARRHAIEGHGVETLGSPVYGGRETRGPRADHHQVVDSVLEGLA